MFDKEAAERCIFPLGAGAYCTGSNLREDTTFDVAIPPELLTSQRIKDVLAFVTDKYLFYLFFGAPHHSEGVSHKISHTNDLVALVLRLYQKHPEYSLEDAVCLALAHDVARALQGGFFNKHSDYATGTDHGLIGAEMYQRAFPDDHKVYAGILYHNKLEPNENNYLIELIQDVDRLAIYRRIFDTNGAESYQDYTGCSISCEVLEDFSAGRLVHKAKVRSEADDWICSLSWIWIFKLEAARQYLSEQQYPEKIVRYIVTKFHPTAAEAEILHTTVKSWHKQYNV